jgi:hypothetical protein
VAGPLWIIAWFGSSSGATVQPSGTCMTTPAAETTCGAGSAPAPAGIDGIGARTGPGASLPALRTAEVDAGTASGAGGRAGDPQAMAHSKGARNRKRSECTGAENGQPPI